MTFVGEESEPYDPKYISTDTTNFQLGHLECPAEYERVEYCDVTLWVDPLDGTACFVGGHLDHVTVMIGVAVGGEPVAGVINRPFCESGGNGLVWGMKGLGVHGLGKVRNGDGKSPKRKRIITSMFREIEGVESVVKKLEDKGVEVEVIRQGGAGNKVLKVRNCLFNIARH